MSNIQVADHRGRRADNKNLFAGNKTICTKFSFAAKRGKVKDAMKLRPLKPKDVFASPLAKRINQSASDRRYDLT